MSAHSNVTPTMQVIEATWNGQISFKLVPAVNYAPFVECIFDPKEGFLGLILPHKAQKMVMVARLDENGDKMPKKGRGVNPNEPQTQRVTVEHMFESYIEKPMDIEKFVHLHAINPQHPAFLHHFPDGTIVEPKYQTEHQPNPRMSAASEEILDSAPQIPGATPITADFQRDEEPAADEPQATQQG